MKITISAELSDEQVYVLSQQKGYNPSVLWEDGTPTDNPMSRADFIRSIYENMIVSDATYCFINFENNKKLEEQVAFEQAIRSQVASSIVSSVE